MTTQLALIVNQPARAVDLLVKLRPELTQDDAPIAIQNCEAAIIVAAAWQRMDRQPEAQRLLRRVGGWIDGPDSPHWPEMRITRAQVHALLGERPQALDALDRAFEEGFRGTLAVVTNGYPYGGEDNPLFQNIRSEPRFIAWYARLHADNARQLAVLKEKESTEKGPVTSASQ